MRAAVGTYDGDFVASALQAPGAMAAYLTRESVYVRLSLRSLSNTSSLVTAASSSYKDVFLLCLVSPPDSRTEKALLGKVRATHSAGAAERMAKIHRLNDAEQGLQMLLPAFAARIESAQRVEDLFRLEAELKKAPIEEALRALRASLLVFALDEEGTGQGPTELDGERPHDVRVHFVDLSSNTTLLRLRKHVDPRGISEATRAMFAAGIDSCSLALDILDSLGTAPSPPAKK
jgi:hypothetical protein